MPSPRKLTCGKSSPQWFQLSAACKPSPAVSAQSSRHAHEPTGRGQQFRSVLQAENFASGTAGTCVLKVRYSSGRPECLCWGSSLGRRLQPYLLQSDWLPNRQLLLSGGRRRCPCSGKRRKKTTELISKLVQKHQYITESIKHTPLSHIYLVELSDERLSGCNGSGAIHFEIGEAILPHEHLQDLQHLCVWEKGFQTEH